MSNKVMKNQKPSPKGKRKKKILRQEKEIIDTEKKEVSDVIGGRSVLRRSDENDPSWYARDIQLLRDAFSISTAERLGVPFESQLPNLSATAWPFTTKTTSVVSGIFNLLVLPVPGISTNANSAANAAARKLFTQVRRTNSGYSNYEPTDLMLYLLAIDNMYMLWNWLVRLYGIVNLYSSRNAYLPDGLLASMNVSKNVLKDSCQLRCLINQLQAKVNTFCVPAYLSYFSRHSWLFSNIWMDSNNSKAQLYILNPHSLYKWVEQTEATVPSYLQPISLCNNTRTWTIDGLQGLVDEMVNAVYYSEDFALISGDILKSFGRENCFTLPIINESFVVIPTYNPEVLTQLSNAKITDSYINVALNDTFRITQNIVGTGDLATSSIVFNPNVNINYYGVETDNYLYNFHTDDVTPEVASVATRLNYIPSLYDATHTAQGGYMTTKLSSCSSELIVGAEIFTCVPSNGSFSSSMVRAAYYGANSFTAADVMMLMQCSQFSWAPLIKVVAGGKVYYTSDLDNYTLIGHNTLASMNDVALLSMFGIPGPVS